MLRQGRFTLTNDIKFLIIKLMAVIDPTSPVLVGTDKQYWLDQLSNAKILLYRVQIGIQTLIDSGHKSYKLDTGQNDQEVERLPMSSLQKMQEDLISQIHDLEIKCGVNGHGAVIARPAW